MTGNILALPKNEGCYVLDTYVLDFGLGAVISQRHTKAFAEAFALKPGEKPRVTQFKKSYRLCFKGVIESQKQIRNDAEGIVSHSFLILNNIVSTCWDVTS